MTQTDDRPVHRQTCPECRGACGRFVWKPSPSGQPLEVWRACGQCGGTGVVLLWGGLRAVLILLALCGCSVPAAGSAAEKLRPVINGPTDAIPGEIVTLDASESEGEPTHFSWRIAPEIVGRRQLEILDGGRRCRVASFPGVYLVTLVVSNDAGNELLYWTIRVPGKSPEPAPGPQPIPPGPIPGPDPTPEPDRPDPEPPKPTPEPTIPTGEFNVAKPVYDLAKANLTPAQALQFADGLSPIAAQVAAGTITNAQALLNELAKGLDKHLPTSAAFRTGISALLQATFETHKAGRLKVGFTGAMSDPAAWAQLLREAETGLRAWK